MNGVCFCIGDFYLFDVPASQLFRRIMTMVSQKAENEWIAGYSMHCAIPRIGRNWFCHNFASSSIYYTGKGMHVDLNQSQKSVGTKPDLCRSSHSDAELVRATRAGDKFAFVEIVARYQGLLCGIALGILSDFAASEDAAQEAFLTAWRKIDDLREPERLRPWLTQIARNTALAQLRRKGSRHEGLESASDIADESPTPDQSAASDEEAAMVSDALAALPEEYRLPLVLYYREDQSARAVAQLLEISEDAARQRLARGREMLRARIARIVERVLVRKAPGPVFTMSIAAAIGALATPAAVAGSVFAAAAPTATSTPILTAMSTSKSFIATAALLIVLCVPVGYHLGSDEDSSGQSNHPAQRAEVTAPPIETRPGYEETALFAEWRQLHEKYGTNGPAMPVLHKVIGEIDEPFRRRAFHTALMAEWVQVDPAAGLEFLLQKGSDSRQRRQFVDEWLRVDAASAVEGLMLQPGSDEILREFLPEIARTVPERVLEITSRLPEPAAYWDTQVRDAFTILAERNFGEARELAQSVSGPNREQALSGIALHWAKRDLDGAVNWARQLPGKIDRDEIVRAALIGQAATDPIAALDKLDLVGTGGRHLHANSTTAARVLYEASKSDFEGTLSWIVDHPGRLNRDDLDGINSAVSERLNADPLAFLTLRSNEGSLPVLVPAVRSALMNLASGQHSVVWDWLKAQPESETVSELREGVLGSAAWKDIDLAFDMVEKLGSSKENAADLKTVAQRIWNGGDRLDRFDHILARAPEQLRSALAETAFESLSSESMPEPQIWIERLSALPENSRAKGTEKIARAWAQTSPDEAVEWARSLPGEDVRRSAVAGITTGWARMDAFNAAEWVSSIPTSPERDSGAHSLVMAIADKYPQEAWEWSLSIQDPVQQKKAALKAARSMAVRDPLTAEILLHKAALPDETRKEVATILRLAGGSSARLEDRR